MAKSGKSTAMRTKKGNVTAKARSQAGMAKTGKFPIFDKKSALAALRLRGHGTTPSQRSSIITRAAKYAPAAAQKARDADKKKAKK